MWLIGDIDHRFCVLVLPSPVSSTEDHEEYDRHGKYEQVNNNHGTLRSALRFQLYLSLLKYRSFHTSTWFDAVCIV
jgi:hypothetical protein